MDFGSWPLYFISSKSLATLKEHMQWTWNGSYHRPGHAYFLLKNLRALLLQSLRVLVLLTTLLSNSQTITTMEVAVYKSGFLGSLLLERATVTGVGNAKDHPEVISKSGHGAAHRAYFSTQPSWRLWEKKKL